MAKYAVMHIHGQDFRGLYSVATSATSTSQVGSTSADAAFEMPIEPRWRRQLRKPEA